MAKAIISYDKGLPEIPDRRPWEKPTSFLVKDPTTESGWRVDASGRRPSRLLLIPKLRTAVDQWRNDGYPGASEVTRRLFAYWFDEAHEVAGFAVPFRYHFCQREAIETLAYLVEVARIGDAKILTDAYAEVFHRDLLSKSIAFQTTMDGQRQIRRYVPELEAEGVQDLPPEWRGTWSQKVILRGESTEPDPSGNLFLTNIHQLYESRDQEWTPQNAIKALLGRKPAKDLAASQRSSMERIKELKDLVVLNDEAHHVHDDNLAWSQSLLSIHRALPKGLSLWLDFSATPKDQNGMYFPWTVCGYPLAQAVEDRIVKAPIIVTKEDDPRQPAQDPDHITKDNVAEKYGYWIQAAVQRWKEHDQTYGAGIWIIETKGRVWEGTEAKDAAMRDWCARVSEQTGATWTYARVDQSGFDVQRPTTLAEVARRGGEAEACFLL
jgi:Type III restriction enzyme, res subunit